jgi:hypothetical protein
VGASVVGKVSSQKKDVAEAAGRTLRSLSRDSEAEREGQCRSRWGMGPKAGKEGKQRLWALNGPRTWI